MENIGKQKKLGLVECELNDILFPVEMVEQTSFACNSDYQYDIFGYLNGDANKGIIPVKTRLNSCSNRYELVPNADIFPPVRVILQSKEINFEETYMHLNNARFYAEYKIMDNPYLVGGNPNDKIFPMLKVQHSYNGMTKYMINFGYYRLVCTNGLTIPVKEKDEFNIAITGKHTSSIQNSLLKLREVINVFVEQGNKYLVNFDSMTDRAITNIDDRIEEVMNAAKISLIDNKNLNTIQYVKTIVDKESMDLYGGVTNDWLIYNAINQYVNDNKMNVKTPEVRSEIDKKVLQYMLADVN
jgi:hypothetical protein